MSALRDVLVVALDPTTAEDMWAMDDGLMLAGMQASVALSSAILVVPADPAAVRAFVADMPGTWLVIDDPSQVPEGWGETYDELLAAWATTAMDEMVIVEYGSRPDLGRSFGDLGGCVW